MSTTTAGHANRPTVVPRKRRGAELFLLVLAVAIGAGAWALVGLGTEGSVPADMAVYGGTLAGFALLGHIVIRFVAPYADPVILPIVIALNGLGLAMIHRIDHADATDRASNQLMWMGLATVLFVGVLLVVRDHRWLQQYTYTVGFAGVVLLLLPLVPGLGREIYGARIWIGIGPFSFQPGEVAKIALAVFFAGYLVMKRDALALAGRRILGVDLPRARDLGPILMMWAVSLVILVGQKDLGSSLLFFGLFVVLLYVATERASWIIVGFSLFAGGAYLGYLFFSHVQVRVDAWLHPFDEVGGQLANGLFGMAWGGMVGRGLGLGQPYRTPFSYSDFIGTSMAEELGLTGMMAIILMFGLLAERGLRTALVCRDPFGKLLAVGLSVSFVLQVFIVLGGVTRLIPLTGLTTPFMSQGGSSLLANWILAALLIRVSHTARQPVPELVAPTTPDDETQAVKTR